MYIWVIYDIIFTILKYSSLLYVITASCFPTEGAYFLSGQMSAALSLPAFPLPCPQPHPLPLAHGECLLSMPVCAHPPAPVQVHVASAAMSGCTPHRK